MMSTTRALPTGTVTFLFTDIEGSTQLWERVPDLMREALARHNELLDAAVRGHDGVVFKTVGDAYCASFHTAQDGLRAAVDAQRALGIEPWRPECAIRVRMAVHTGAVQEQGGDYFGPPVNRVARLLSTGHGGQTLLSEATCQEVRDSLPERIELEDLGEHRLKDLIQPEHIYQVMGSGLRRDPPPIKSLDYRPTNLPIQPSPFVGRSEEVEYIVTMLERPDVRLLTLTGPGGSGKTRLALEAGAASIDGFKHGVFFVSLAAITDPDLIASSIATALKVREVPGHPVLETLKEHLRDRAMLLIVDNFEHVLSGAPILTELSRVCSGLKILATSRSVLQLTGEYDYSVPPLSIPDLKYLPAVNDLLHFDAIALFVQRAQAAKGDFSLTAENSRAVAEICAGVDGLPLAIELAAARVKVFPPQILLGRLSRRLSLLTGGARDLPSRQQTLRATIDWSFSLLSEQEQQLFAQLSVFAGGCTTEAANAVCGPDRAAGESMERELASLVDKSLLRQDDVRTNPVAGPRFRMLSTIREYAFQRLQVDGDSELVQRRHAEHFVALAEEAEPTFRAAEQEVWLDRLEVEHDNMRAALEWALDGKDSELALRLSSALHRFWQVHGHLSEGRQWLDQVLSQAGSIRTRDQIEALIGAGWLASYQDDLKGAQSFLDRALDLARELDDELGIADALYALSHVARVQGGYERGRELLEESLDLYLMLNDTWGIAIATNDLANLANLQGDFARGEELFTEALALARHLGQGRIVGILLFNLGYTKWCLGCFEEAQELYEEALRSIREVGDKLVTAMTLGELGMVSSFRGDHQRAQALLTEGLELFRELDRKVGFAEWLENGARVKAFRGQAECAAVLHGAADGLRELLGAPLSPADLEIHERDLAPARAELGDRWHVAWEQGRNKPLEEAIALVLAE
jgi:predicted ATPase/class 3 adenylate cyclase